MGIFDWLPTKPGNDTRSFYSGEPVTYWPPTELSFKKCTSVNNSCIRSKISEYHLHLLTRLNAVQMRTPTGSRWVSNNYITRCHRRFEWVQFEMQLEFELQFQLEIRCRSENQLQTWGLGPQDPGWAAQQNEEEVLQWPDELGVNVWQPLSVSNSPHTHNQHQSFRDPFENKVWEVYFYKEVCSFVPLESSLLLTMFPRIFIYNICMWLSSSSSYRAGSADIPDPLSPLLPIVHRPR